jgi:hypothetical protein
VVYPAWLCFTRMPSGKHSFNILKKSNWVSLRAAINGHYERKLDLYLYIEIKVKDLQAILNFI